MGNTIALAGYFSISFGIMFTIAIANRHTLSPIAQRRLPAVAALLSAIGHAGTTLMILTITPLWAAIEIAIFALLLWGLLNIARTVPDGQQGIAVSMIMIIAGTLCLKVFNYVR